jgi:hypothetical protein
VNRQRRRGDHAVAGGTAPTTGRISTGVVMSRQPNEEWTTWRSS